MLRRHPVYAASSRHCDAQSRKQNIRQPALVGLMTAVVMRSLKYATPNAQTRTERGARHIANTPVTPRSRFRDHRL